MTSTTVRDGEQDPGVAFVRGMPFALVACAGYFVFFAALWGPTRPWKLLVVLVVFLGLSLTIRLGNPWGDSRAERRRLRAQGHEAASRARWPAWRRVASVATGLALCFAGIYQSLGIEVDIGGYPLLSALCLIVSCGVGVTLIAWGLPRIRWRRRAPRTGAGAPPPDDAPRAPRDVPAPTRTRPAGATSFRMPVPKEQPFRGGMWGGIGFGSKPARKVWKPGGSSSAADGPPEPVPEKYRRVRLLRRRRSRVAPSSGILLLVLFGAAFVAALVYWVMG